MVAKQLLGYYPVVRKYRADTVQQQAGLLGSGEILHEQLYRRSFLEKGEVWPVGRILGHKNVRMPGLILGGVELAVGVPGVKVAET
jgi:hypothetical protein